MNYLDCLPQQISAVLRRIDGVREVRIRSGSSVCVNVNGQRRWLRDDGLTDNKTKAFIFDGSCDDIVNKACQGSVYAFESMLAQGYFTLDDGTRFGVCGRYIESNGVFQNFSSLCLRIAHKVNCLGFDVLESVAQSKAVVFVGPPCSGKTTCLRCLAEYLSLHKNVVVCDERAELSLGSNLSACDVLSCASKQYAFSVAVRTLSPDWIVCDELSDEDENAVVRALLGGVKVACSVHGQTFEDMKKSFGKLSDFVSTAVLLDKSHNQTVVECPTMSKNRGL